MTNQKPNLRLLSSQKPEAGESMYAARKKIYPRETTGLFQNLRRVTAWVVLGGFYLLAWVPWGSRQAVLFDLPARRFHIFWLTFYPQDFIYLALLLVIAAVALLFFTALAGRLWCGYTCPQTLWTELFLWIEHLTEGDRAARIKLDKRPWSIEKLRRKGSKQILWIGLAAWTGFTFVGYFTPIHDLFSEVLHFQMGSWETFWTLFYGLATYGNAGYLREQVCMYMCPYARFQGAMFDQNTLIISYDQSRGEPRGSRRRDSDHRASGLGDCVDCTLCVQVCPTGIDIRDGLQYECIACASCIDVCNQVMDKVGYERGLIRYTTLNAMEGKSTQIIRPRVVVYSLILLGMSGSVAYSILNRAPMALDILHDRNALYRIREDGHIENSYTLKVANRSEDPHRYVIGASGLTHLHIETDPQVVEVAAGEIAIVPTRVNVPANTVKGGATIIFTLQLADGEGDPLSQNSRFLAPVTTR